MAKTKERKHAAVQHLPAHEVILDRIERYVAFLNGDGPAVPIGLEAYCVAGRATIWRLVEEFLNILETMALPEKERLAILRRVRALSALDNLSLSVGCRLRTAHLEKRLGGLDAMAAAATRVLRPAKKVRRRS